MPFCGAVGMRRGRLELSGDSGDCRGRAWQPGAEHGEGGHGWGATASWDVKLRGNPCLTEREALVDAA